MVVVVVVVVVVGDGSRRVCSSSTSGENERPDMRLETKRHNKPTETEKSKRSCIMRDPGERWRWKAGRAPQSRAMS